MRRRFGFMVRLDRFPGGMFRFFGRIPILFGFLILD